MINYVPINLSNRKFYVGSAIDFNSRWKKHLRSKYNYPFQNALRKNPNNFFVLISEDDGLDTREEEQFYLDFYHGSEWCYNLNPKADAPDPRVCSENGRKGGKLTGGKNADRMREEKKGIFSLTPEELSYNGLSTYLNKQGAHNPENREKVIEGARKAGKQNGSASCKKRSKPVVCVETGVTYPSLTDASASTGVQRPNIGSCCRGTREKAGGFHWKFAEVK
jgi:group I intron endonuclease